MTSNDLSGGKPGEKSRNELPILMYHDIGPCSDNPQFREFVLEASLFADHLSALRDEGFVSEPSSRLPDIEAAKTPGSPVFITFDDAYVSYSEVVQPLLDQYKMTATLFVPTAFVGGRARWLDAIGEGQRRILSWQEIRDLRTSGTEIGGHGHEHLQLDLLSHGRLVADIVTNRTLLEDHLGVPIPAFAYPFGYHSWPVRRVVRRAGYELAFQVAHDLYAPSAGRHYSIKRIQVGPDMSPEQLIEAIRYGRSSRLVRRARLYLVPFMQLARRQRRSWQSRKVAG
jgi:peptidoglycan/xylan/chitin deacetylase (PgdA/CDA1 family)